MASGKEAEWVQIPLENTLRDLEQKLITNEKLDHVQLWKRLNPRSTKNEIETYSLMKNLVKKTDTVPPSQFYHETAPTKLLKILEGDHGPQIYSLAIALIGHLCNVNSTVKVDLVNKGHLIRDLMDIMELATGRKEGTSRARYSGSWHKDCQHQIMVYLFQQVSSLLFYFSLGPTICHDHMVFEGATKTMVEIAKPSNTITYSYSQAAVEVLRKIALGKDLIGKKDQLLPNEEVQKVFECQARNHLSDTKTIHQQGVLLTSLFDTSLGEDLDIDVRDSLLKSKAVWPLAEETTEESEEWVDVHVTSIVDGHYFWAHVGNHSDLLVANHISQVLSDWPLDKRDYVKRVPKPGDFLAAHHNKNGYFRGQVLCVKGNMVALFSLDYGVICDVFMADTFYITPDMDISEPAQATLCRIAGVRPPCSNLILVENALKILCNLSVLIKPVGDMFEQCHAAQKLLPLISCPERTLQVLALRIYNNMARDDLLRLRIGSSGTIPVLLDQCQPYSVGSIQSDRGICEFLELVLGVLGNVLYDCSDNKSIFVDNNGVESLLPFTPPSTPVVIRRAALKALRVFTGTLNTSPMTDTDKPLTRNTTHLDRLQKLKELAQVKNFPRDEGDDKLIAKAVETLSSIDDEHSTRDAHHRSRSRGGSTESRSRSHSRGASRGHSSRSSGRLKSQEADTRSRQRSKSIETNRNRGTVYSSIDIRANYNQDSSDEEVSPTTESETEIKYVKGCRTSIIPAVNCEIMAVMEAEKIMRDVIVQHVCGLLNYGKGGSIFIGLKQSGRVSGITITRNQRDEFRNGIDQGMKNCIKPTVPPNICVVTFTAVHEENEPVAIKDLFIIEIKIKPQQVGVYSCNDTPFTRVDTQTEEYYFYDMLKDHIRKEEEHYVPELEHLEKELLFLRKELGVA